MDDDLPTLDAIWRPQPGSERNPIVLLDDDTSTPCELEADADLTLEMTTRLAERDDALDAEGIHRLAVHAQLLDDHDDERARDGFSSPDSTPSSEETWSPDYSVTREEGAWSPDYSLTASELRAMSPFEAPQRYESGTWSPDYTVTDWESTQPIDESSDDELDNMPLRQRRKRPDVRSSDEEDNVVLATRVKRRKPAVARLERALVARNVPDPRPTWNYADLKRFIINWSERHRGAVTLAYPDGLRLEYEPSKDAPVRVTFKSTDANFTIGGRDHTVLRALQLLPATNAGHGRPGFFAGSYRYPKKNQRTHERHPNYGYHELHVGNLSEAIQAFNREYAGHVYKAPPAVPLAALPPGDHTLVLEIAYAPPEWVTRLTPLSDKLVGNPTFNSHNSTWRFHKTGVTTESVSRALRTVQSVRGAGWAHAIYPTTIHINANEAENREARVELDRFLSSGRTAAYVSWSDHAHTLCKLADGTFVVRDPWRQNWFKNNTRTPQAGAKWLQTRVTAQGYSIQFDAEPRTQLGEGSCTVHGLMRLLKHARDPHSSIRAGSVYEDTVDYAYLAMHLINKHRVYME